MFSSHEGPCTRLERTEMWSLSLRSACTNVHALVHMHARSCLHCEKGSDLASVATVEAPEKRALRTVLELTLGLCWRRAEGKMTWCTPGL